MPNKWLQHVKQVKAANQGMQLKQVLKLAAQSYKKQKQQQGGGGGCADNAAPVSEAAENFAHGGAEAKDPEKESTAESGLGDAQAGGKKRRSRKNKQQKQQQGGKKRRSRKAKGKKSKRRAAGKKSKRRTRRRRRR